MPKYTLLELVQKAARAIDSDEIASISDTPESLDIAAIAEDTFYELISKRDWPHLRTLVQGTASVTYPSYMGIPVRVREIDSVRYNRKKTAGAVDLYEEIIYLDPESFLDLQNNLNSSASNVTTATDPSGVTYNIRNDIAPSYYTSFDDEWLAFNSYNATLDNNLQSSKSQIVVIRDPVWTSSDVFVPDLPIEAFPLLISELIVNVGMVFNQEANAKEEQKAARQMRRMAGKSWTVERNIGIPYYGRK